MVNPLKKSIEGALREIPRVRKDLEEQERIAKEDDKEITESDPNYNHILVLRKNLKHLEATVSKKRKEHAANKAKWESSSSDRSATRAQIDEVIAWGDPRILKIKESFDKAHETANDEWFSEATTQYNDIEKAFRPVHNEFIEQSFAKEIYNGRLDDIFKRLKVLDESGVTSDTAKASRGQIDANLQSADAPTASLDYKEAVRLLDLGNTEITRYESEIARLTKERGEAETELTDFQKRLYDIESKAAKFEDIKKRTAVVRGTEAAIVAAMGQSDFVSARQQIASNEAEMDLIQTELDRAEAELAAEEERKNQELASWQRRDTRWTTYQANVAELLDWGAPLALELSTLEKEVKGYVSAREYQRACDVFDPAEAKLNGVWPSHLEQKATKATYEATVTPLEKRLEAARTSTALTEELQKRILEATSMLENAQIAADGKDYLSAMESIKDLPAHLDKLEQGIRDAEVRAQVEAEMGSDGNSTDPAVEDEINKRLFDAEFPPFEGRVSDADGIIASEALGFSIKEAANQLATDLDSINGLVASGDYAGAVAGVRTGVTSMNALDKMIRDQRERRDAYEQLMKQIRQDHDPLLNSSVTAIAKEAALLTDQLANAERDANAGEYVNALQVARHWHQQVKDLQKRNDIEIALQSKVHADWTALAPRWEAAKSVTQPEIEVARQAVSKSGELIQAAVLEQRYADASGEIGNLRTLLDEFEKEAEAAKTHQRYQDTLGAFPNLEKDTKAVEDSKLPDAADERQAVLDLDARRKAHVEAGEWSEARSVVYDQDSKINVFNQKVGFIDHARAMFESESKEIFEKTDSILTKEVEDPSGNFDTIRQELSKTKMFVEMTAGDQAWIAALKLLGKLMTDATKAEEVMKTLLQADRGRINQLISDQLQFSTGYLLTGINFALVEFKSDVMDEIQADRSFQETQKTGSYYLDFGSAAAGLGTGAAIIIGSTPIGWAAIAAGLAMTKIIWEMEASRQDAIRDAEAKQMLGKAIKYLGDEAAKVIDGYNSSQSQLFEKNAPDVYRKIGNHLYNDNPDAAKAVLSEQGVPNKPGDQNKIRDHYLKMLRSQAFLK